MIRKTAIATVAVAALALGTASATSLGTFDDVAFAASDIDLLDCVLDSDAIALIPNLPSVGTLVADPTVATATALIGSVDIDLTSLAIDAVSGLPNGCLDDELFTVVMLDNLGVIGTYEVLGSTLAATMDGDDVVSIGVGLFDLDGDGDPLTIGSTPDVASITEVRMVLSDTL